MDTVDGFGMLKTVRNRSDFVENGSEMGWTGRETDYERRAIRWGWTRNILENILLARLAARLGSGLGGSNMARMWLSRRLPLGAWATVTEVSNNACGIPLAPMKLIFAPVSSYGWTLHRGMIKMLITLKIRVYPKTHLFSDERGSDTNCWWKKPLVVTLKHSEGIKHTVLFQ